MKNESYIKKLSQETIQKLDNKPFTSTSEEMSFQDYVLEDAYKKGFTAIIETPKRKLGQFLKNEEIKEKFELSQSNLFLEDCCKTIFNRERNIVENSIPTIMLSEDFEHNLKKINENIWKE